MEEEEREEIRTSSLALIWTPGAVRSSVQSSWCHSNDADPPPRPAPFPRSSGLRGQVSHLTSALSPLSRTLQLWQSSLRLQFTGDKERFCWICMLRSEGKKSLFVLLFSAEELQVAQVIRGLGSCSEMIPPLYKKGIWEEDAHISQNRKNWYLLIPKSLLTFCWTLKVQLLCLSPFLWRLSNCFALVHTDRGKHSLLK